MVESKVRRTMKFAACCCAVFLLAAGSISADEKLTILVRPTVGIHPSDVVVYAFVERNAENRAVQAIADSPAVYASSQIQLDGEQAPRASQFIFRDMPEGEYSVLVVLTGQNGKQLATASRRVIIR
jgi:hypothetical protein